MYKTNPSQSLANSEEPALYTLPGIAAGASVTAKTINEDACQIRSSDKLCTIAVADGLGSSFDSHVAASIATATFVAECAKLTTPAIASPAGVVSSIWAGVEKRLHEHYTANRDHYSGQPAPLQTTLLGLVDTGDSYLFTYLGNGSVLYVRGDFWRFKGRDWPWCRTDLMVGHSFLDASGKDRLYGLVGPHGLTAQPNVGLVSKDQKYGEFLIVCTDGISSADHVKVGRDPQQKLWIEANPQVEYLIGQTLPQFLRDMAGNSEPEQALVAALQAFLTARTFDDDATLAVLVSRQALHYAKYTFGK
jgi:PPM family protein phosphatase